MRNRTKLTLIVLIIVIAALNLSFRPDNGEKDKGPSSSWFQQMAKGQSEKSELKRLLVRFESLLAYLESNHLQVNIDGLFGIRVAQGAIHKSLMSMYKSKRYAKQSVLSQLKARIDKLADSVMTNVEAKFPSYYQGFSGVVSQQFVLNDMRSSVNWDMLKMVFVYEGNNFTGLLDARLSDYCLKQIQKPGLQRCGFEDDCFRLVTEPQTSGKIVSSYIKQLAL